MKYIMIFVRRARLERFFCTDCFAAMKYPPSLTGIIYRYSNVKSFIRQVNRIVFFKIVLLNLMYLCMRTGNPIHSTVKKRKNIVAYSVGGYANECE